MEDMDNEIAQTQEQISDLEQQRNKVRNQIRHETDPAVLAENKAERAAITQQITPLRKKIKHIQRIRKDVPRLLNLIKQELTLEYELKQQLKQRPQQKNRSYDRER